MQTKTVATLQTPPGLGGIAVIGLTGPRAEQISAKIFRPHKKNASTNQLDTLQLGFLRDGDEKLDEAIICKTSRGVEINIHGGSAVARRVMQKLTELGAAATANSQQTSAFEPAHPQWRNPAIGEEMLSALPKAAGLGAATAISQQWSAGLSKLASRGLGNLANLGNDNDKDKKNLAGLLRRAADFYFSGTIQKLLNPAEVVLAGPPNAGKSTLANALAGRPISIVHETAGTTRDWVREMTIVKGAAIWLTDTAGLWETADAIDAEAVRRAWQRIEQAELILLISHEKTLDLPPEIHAKALLHIATKSDLATKNSNINADIRISAKTGEGMEDLKTAIIEKLGLAEIDPAEPMAFTQRQADLLFGAANALDQNNSAVARDKLATLLG